MFVQENNAQLNAVNDANDVCDNVPATSYTSKKRVVVDCHDENIEQYNEDCKTNKTRSICYMTRDATIKWT